MKQKTNRFRDLSLRVRWLFGAMLLAAGIFALGIPKALADNPGNYNYVIMPPADDGSLHYPDGSNPLGNSAPRIQFIMDNTLPSQSVGAGTSVGYIPYQFFVSSTLPQLSFQLRGGGWNAGDINGDGVVDDRDHDFYDRTDGNPGWVVNDFIKKRGFLSPIYYEVYQLTNDDARSGRLLGIINTRDTNIFPSLDRNPNNDNCDGGGCWRQFDDSTSGGSITLNGGTQDSCASRLGHANQCTNPLALGAGGSAIAQNSKSAAPETDLVSQDSILDSVAFASPPKKAHPQEKEPRQPIISLLHQYGESLKEFISGSPVEAVQTHQIHVSVNPSNLAAGANVRVLISGGACADNEKFVDGNGNVTFFACPDGHTYTISLPDTPFDYNGQHCTAGANQTTSDDNNPTVNIFYNCVGSHSITVYVNPRGHSPGKVTVQITGGACNGANGNSQPVGPGGSVTFGQCVDGNTYTAIVKEDQFDDGNVHCTAPNDKTQLVGGDNTATFTYSCEQSVANDGNNVGGVTMNDGHFKPVAADSNTPNNGRFQSFTQPNLNGNYVFLIKAVNFEDLAHGYVSTYDRLKLAGDESGCPVEEAGNEITCPTDLFDRADNENTERVLQNGFYIRAPKTLNNSSNNRQYLASATSKISFGISLGPTDANQQSHYEGLNFQAGGISCRQAPGGSYSYEAGADKNPPYLITTADWDRYSGQFSNGFEGRPNTPDSSTPISAKLNRTGVRDDMGNLYSGIFNATGYPSPFVPVVSKEVGATSISGSWQSSTTNNLEAVNAQWAVQINNPGRPDDNTPYNYTPEGGNWQQNETYAGQLAIRQWNDGNQLLQGGQAFTTGFWPTCRQPTIDLQTPKDGYTYDGQNSTSAQDVDGNGQPDYVQGQLGMKFSYTLPEFRGQVQYKVQLYADQGATNPNLALERGGTVNKNDPDGDGQDNNVGQASGVASGANSANIPVDVGDLKHDMPFYWRACISTNNWVNQTCSSTWRFSVNQGPTAQALTGNAIVPNTDTNVPPNTTPGSPGVNYKCAQMSTSLTDPESSPSQVRPYYEVTWTDGNGFNIVDSYTKQATSDTGFWSNWLSGNYGYKDSGSTFTSDEVSPRLWRRGSSLVDMTPYSNMTMTKFLQDNVADGVDVTWRGWGEDRYGASDVGSSPVDPFYLNSNPLSPSNSGQPAAGDQQSPLPNRRFGLPITTTFHKNSPPEFNTASTKQFKDLAGNKVTSVTDGQELLVETKFVNGGETPAKFYSFNDYLGSIRDFQNISSITIKKNNGPAITVPLDRVQKVVANRSNANLDQVLTDPIDPHSSDYQNGAYRIELGDNQSGLLADSSFGGAGNFMNPGDTITLTYQVRANRNQQLTAGANNADYTRHLTPTDTHFWAFYEENYCNDNDRVGKSIDKLPGTVTAPWLRAQRGSVASNGGIFGYDALSGQSNATFLVQANGALSHFTSKTSTQPNYTSATSVCTAQGERPGGVDWRRTMISNINKLQAGTSHNAAETRAQFDSPSGQVNLNQGNKNVWIVGSPGNPSGLTMSHPEAFKGTGTLLVFGDLTIGPGANLSYQPDTAGTNSLGVIVVGNLNIDPSVTNLVGSYYVLDSDPSVDSNGCPVNIDVNKTTRGRVNTGSSNNKLNIQGLLVAGAYDFLRYFTDVSDSTLDPAENIYYDGRVLANTPPGFGTFRNTASWQEIAP